MVIRAPGGLFFDFRRVPATIPRNWEPEIDLPRPDTGPFDFSPEGERQTRWEVPDRVAFANDAGLPPDPWQERLLLSEHHRILLNCSRQSGKSTMSAILAMHTAIYQPGSLIIIVSRAARQSSELMDKAKTVFHGMGRQASVHSESVLQLRLSNGSRIIALPGKEETIRSYSGVTLLLIDEAARVPDATYFSVRPMLAVSGGRLVALSSPFGRRGWYWEAWSGGADWERYEIPATQCPRITSKFLAEERAAMGDWWFKQEYLCEFLQPMDSAFNADAVARAFGGGILPLFMDELPPPGSGIDRLFTAI